MFLGPSIFHTRRGVGVEDFGITFESTPASGSRPSTEYFLFALQTPFSYSFVDGPPGDRGGWGRGGREARNEEGMVEWKTIVPEREDGGKGNGN